MVLTNMLAGTELGQLVGVINLTPYDGHLERYLLKRSLHETSRCFRSLTVSPDSTTTLFSQKTCAMLLFEDLVP